MKKVLTTSVIALVASFSIITSCIKKPQPAKQVFAHWNGMFRNCDVAKKGTCYALAKPSDGKLESIAIGTNEGAGTVVTKQLENGKLLTTITLTKLNLSAELEKQMLTEKVLRSDGETLIPADLMNASFEAAGLSIRVTEPVVLPAGDMPLVLQNSAMKTVSTVSVELSANAPPYHYVGHVSLLK
ncbi:MAG: hypothetical protein RL660_1162 [Bacteroidota bacterium]|jgi:hypothetical protein